MAIIVICAFLHRGWRELLVTSIFGAVLLGGLVAGQGRLYQLPLGVQRTLTFLPGRWSHDVVADAENSTRWRVELWKTVLREKAIKNWWIGDGMGVSFAQIDVEPGPGNSSTDMALVTGYFHNGPLTAIRFAGVIGLIMFYLLMITAAIYSVRCVQRCRGAPLFPLSVFLAAQLLWFPIHFTFVFGSYNGDFIDIVYLTALLRLAIAMADKAEPEAIPAVPYQAAAASLPALFKATG
jgi:hypothetical protein